MDAWQLIRVMAGRRHPTDRFCFKCYPPGQSTKGRFPFDPPRMLFSKTVDQLLRATDRDPLKVAGKLFGGRAADPPDLKLDYFSCAQILDPAFIPPVARKPGEVYAICSTVVPESGSEMHLPLLDFRTDAPREGSAAEGRCLDVLCAALKLAGARSGALLRSGASYHYYGYDPLPADEWRGFLQRSLLLEPLVDVRYIAHRLESGRAALRVGQSESKPHMPRVVRCLGD